MTEPPASGELRRLTSLRWFAALLVFLVHADGAVAWSPLHWFNWGGTGVAFFFVLSGFVLAWSARPGTAAAFYWRRFARIYPSMLTVLLVIALAARVLVVPTQTGAARFVASLFGVQAWIGHSYLFAYNTPAWSLSVEFFFYALFPMLLPLLARVRPLRAATASVGGLGVAALVVWAVGVQAATFPPVRLPEFTLGIALALAIRGGWRPGVPVWAATVTVTVAGVVAHWAEPSPLSMYVVVLPFALLIVSAATADVTSRPGWLPAGWLVYLGRVSFCFYLVHQLEMETLVLHENWRHTPSAVAVTFAVALVTAIVLHHAVERPCERWLRAHQPHRDLGVLRPRVER